MSGTAAESPPSLPPVLRVMGIETEYGISALGQVPGEELHPMQLSNHVVKGYGWTDHHASPPAGTTRPRPRCGTSAATRSAATRRTPTS